MSFINNLQNQNISAEEKQAQATSYIQRLESEAGNIQVGTPEWNALPKYQQQRINNLRREINQVRETSWTTPEQYKASQPSTPSTNVYISNEGQFKPKETTETATEINLRTGERIQLRGTSQQIQAYTEYIRQQGQAEKQAKQVQAVKQQEQIKQSPFIEQYEYPFGREYQKVSVSELKKQQQIRVPEDYGFNIRQQLLSQGQQTQSSYLEISPNLFGVKPQPSRIESLQPFSGNQITKESEIYTPDLSQGGFNFFERMSKYGQAKVSEGDLLGYGALFTGTAIGTAYTMSPIGIGESLYKKGVLQTAEDYTIGTAKFFLNLPQNLKGTTPSQKATELLGFGVGGFLGGKVTKFTVEKPYQSLKQTGFTKSMYKWEKSITGEEWKGYEIYEPRTANLWAGETSALVPSERGIPKTTSKIIDVERTPMGFPVTDITGAVLKERQLQIYPKEVFKQETPTGLEYSSGAETMRYYTKKGIFETQVQQKLTEPFFMRTERGLKVIKQGLVEPIGYIPEPSFFKFTESGKPISAVRRSKQVSLFESIPLEQRMPRKPRALLEDKTFTSKKTSMFSSKKAKANVGSILGTDMYIPLEIYPQDIFGKFDEGRAKPKIKQRETIFEEGITKSIKRKGMFDYENIWGTTRPQYKSKVTERLEARQRSSTENIFKPISINIQESKAGNIPSIDIVSIPKIAVIPKQAQKAAQVPKQVQPLDLIFPPIDFNKPPRTPSRPTTPKYPKEKAPEFPNIFLSQPEPTKKKKKKKTKQPRPKGKYQPSLIASSEKLFGKRPSILTGLEIRPINW